MFACLLNYRQHYYSGTPKCGHAYIYVYHACIIGRSHFWELIPTIARQYYTNKYNTKYLGSYRANTMSQFGTVYL